ncbi:hypothetical protein, partial [Salmonella enterica]|uniref:hypothetical protein n=1 Tax=Salmonella enterica TaxID=28901 RepID=UPI00398C4E33
MDNHTRVKILTGEQDIQRSYVLFAAVVITQIQRTGKIYVRAKRVAPLLAALTAQRVPFPATTQHHPSATALQGL